MVALVLANVLAHGAPPSACDGNPVDEALEHFRVLAVDSSPATVAALARCLEALDLPHLAQRHWLELMRMEPDRLRRREALDHVFTIGSQFGDLRSIAWTVEGLPESALPVGDASRDAALYAFARTMVRDQPDLASEVLGDVGQGRWYGEAQLLRGDLLAAAGRPAGALDAYRRVLEGARDRLRASGSAADAGRGGIEAHGPPSEITDAAVLRAAKVHEAEGRLGEAATLLELLQADSPAGPQAGLERARLWLDADPGGQPRAQGRGVRASLRRAAHANAWLPTLGVLDARAWAARCRPRRAERALSRWQADQEAIRLALEGVTSGMPQGHHVWSVHLGEDRVDVGLSDAVRRHLEADADLRGIRAHLTRLDLEEDRLESLGDPAWRSSLGAYLGDLLVDGRARLEALAGDLFLGGVRSMDEELGRARALAEAFDAHRECRTP